MDNCQCLEELGFSSNEAKVYSTLSAHKMLNGYEVAKFSGVARSLVYEVLNRLVAKGYVLRIEGEPSFYKALEWRKLISLLREKSRSDIDRAERYLESLAATENQDDVVLNVAGDKFIATAKRLIAQATAEISVSAWEQELDALSDSLEAAAERGIKVYVFTFGACSLKGTVNFCYKITDVHNLFPYRRTVIIADGGECLVGEVKGDALSVCTRNHAVVSLATDETVLNIFLQRYIQSRGLFDGGTCAEFLQVLKKLSEELGVNKDMTKNFLVYNFQRRFLDEEC